MSDSNFSNENIFTSLPSQSCLPGRHLCYKSETNFTCCNIKTQVCGEHPSGKAACLCPGLDNTKSSVLCDEYDACTFDSFGNGVCLNTSCTPDKLRCPGTDNDTKGVACCDKKTQVCGLDSSGNGACACPGADNTKANSPACDNESQLCGLDSSGNGVCGNCLVLWTKQVTTCNDSQTCSSFHGAFYEQQPGPTPPTCCDSDETSCYSSVNGSKVNCCDSDQKCCNLGRGFEYGLPFTCCDKSEECCNGSNGNLCCGGASGTTCVYPVEAFVPVGACCASNQIVNCSNPYKPCICEDCPDGAAPSTAPSGYYPPEFGYYPPTICCPIGETASCNVLETDSGIEMTCNCYMNVE
jgi:hypothetical protein